MDQQFNPISPINPNSHKTVWPIVVAVIITAFIIGGGVWYWQRTINQKAQQALQQEIDNLKSQIEQLRQSEIDTSGWKIYQNDEYGFEFKYPNDHTIFNAINESNQSFIHATPASDDVKIAEKEGLVFCCEPNILEFQIIKTKISAEDWLKDNKTNLFSADGPKTVDSINFAGRPALQAIDYGRLDSLYKVIIIKDADYLFVVEQGQASDFFNQILSTFKFIK